MSNIQPDSIEGVAEWFEIMLREAQANRGTWAPRSWERDAERHAYTRECLAVVTKSEMTFITGAGDVATVTVELRASGFRKRHLDIEAIVAFLLSG